MVESLLPVAFVVIFFIVKLLGKSGANPARARVQQLLQQAQATRTGPPVRPGQPVPPVRPMAPGQRPPGAQPQMPAQVAGLLQQLLASRQAGGVPGRPQVQQASVPQYQTGQQYPSPSAWQPPYQPPHVGRGLTQHRPPQHKLPPAKGDVESQVRELMAAHNEVGAVRLLCDEQDMGIIEAQAYARSLTNAPAKARRTEDDGLPARARTEADRVGDDDRYVGSAAFATSVFDTAADENVWASGWVDKPEQEDRSDLDELWQTVRNAGAPRPS